MRPVARRLPASVTPMVSRMAVLARAMASCGMSASCIPTTYCAISLVALDVISAVTALRSCPAPTLARDTDANWSLFRDQAAPLRAEPDHHVASGRDGLRGVALDEQPSFSELE